MPSKPVRRSLLVLSAVLMSSAARGQQDPLVRGFTSPPDTAKPRVWWHWMNGQVSKEGIKLDLEWMKRVGIGGFQNFDGGGGGGGGRGAAPAEAPKRVDFL